MSGLTADELKEDPFEGPTIAERRRLLAENGDVQGIWDILSTTPWSMLDLEEMFRLLLRALEVSGARDPAAHAEQLFQRMLTFSACLVLRTHYYIGRILSGHDRSTTGRAALFLPRDLTGAHLSQVLELQGHLAQLLECQGRTARLWQLAQRRSADTLPLRRDSQRERREDTTGRRSGSRDGSVGIPSTACVPEGRNGQGGADETIG